MSNVKSILVGTIGQGIMRSADGGESWRRVGIDAGMHSDALVRTLGNHPDRPGVVFAGTDKGLYRSEDGGQKWGLLDTAMSGICVWAMAIDSSDPNLMFAGTGTPDPAGVFRSTDGGKTWEQRPVEVAEECPNVGVPRVTGIAIDPQNHRDVWVGLEVDGLRHSSDAGETWESINGAIPNPDVHNVAVAAGPPHTVVVVVNNDVYTSGDNGGNWDRLGHPRGVPAHLPPRHHGAARQPQRDLRYDRGHDARPDRHRSCVPGTRARPGRTCSCPWNPTRRCGRSISSPTTRRWCWRAAATGTCTAATTAATRGASCAASSARFRA